MWDGGKAKDQMRLVHESGSKRMIFGRKQRALNSEWRTLFFFQITNRIIRKGWVWQD